MRKLLVDAGEGAVLLGLSERSFHTLRKAPSFPAPVADLGKRMVRWRSADLEAWVAALPAAAASIEPPQLTRGKAKKTAPAWAPVPAEAK